MKKVYIYRESQFGHETKSRPTTFCPLVEERDFHQFNGEENKRHIGSEWYTETDDLGVLLVKLQAHEDELISFRYNNIDGKYRIWIEDEEE